MRIVYVAYLHPEIVPGGAQQVAYEMFRASLEEGHEAFLVSALEANHLEAHGKPGSVIVPMQGEARQFFFFPQHYDVVHLSVADWRSLSTFMDLLRALEPDVVHFHHYHRIGVETLRAVRLACPHALVSLTLHEMMIICLAGGQMVKTGTRQLCEKATPVACHQCFPDMRPEAFTLRARRLGVALAEADLFFFPSEFLATRYVEWGLPAEKSVVIPNGQMDLARGFDRTRRSGLLNRFGFFGQFLDNKGVDLILQALLVLAMERRVPPQGLVVEVNGGNRHYASEAYMKKVRGLLEQLRALGDVGISFIDSGPYGRTELPARMASIDWVLVPSTWWEVFGLVVSEAWMFGRPVLAARIGGLAERVVDGVNGFTFPPRDARALADTMASLVGDETRWTAINGRLAATWTDRDLVRAYVETWTEARTNPAH